MYLVQSCGFYFNVTFVHVLHAWDALSIYIGLGYFLFVPTFPLMDWCLSCNNFFQGFMA